MYANKGKGINKEKGIIKGKERQKDKRTIKGTEGSACQYIGYKIRNKEILMIDRC